jgi:hypothetical protein
MQHDKKLNERTRYTIIPSYSVVLDQQGNTIVLTSEELSKLFLEVVGNISTDESGEYDARKGSQG